MPGKYIFYDFETSGKGKKENANSFGSTPKWEQILQVGAIVADENFQPTNKTLDAFCRPRLSIIAQPGALLTTQKGIRDSLAAQYSSYELISLVNKTFEEWKKDSSNNIFIGHNILEFDETILEYNLFNNLFFPYITRKNRGDTLNLSRALYALNPTSIKTGISERGNPIFKLEKLAEMNNLPIEFAHDALSDVRTSIALTKFIRDSDSETWQQLELTMNKENAINFVNTNKGFCYLTSFGGRVKIQALSMVCESQYQGWFHTLDLSHDPEPLLKASNEEFKKLVKKKNRYVICNKHPILLSGKLATTFPPYDEIGKDLLNQRVNLVYKNKSLAEKFKHMEIDRQLEKEETASQDNIFPESQASLFSRFGQSEILQKFHYEKSWKEKYKLALSLKDPRASFIAKRLIFDESPEVLSEDDFKLVHRELHDRLVINQERPFTTIPEAMTYIDTELAKIEDNDDKDKMKKISLLEDYNTYLLFLEKYFSDKNAQPLKLGKELIKQIYG